MKLVAAAALGVGVFVGPQARAQPVGPTQPPSSASQQPPPYGPVPVPSPEQTPSSPAPNEPMLTPPPLPPEPVPRRVWFGYQEMIGVGVFSLLGIWSSNADFTRDNHVAAASLCLVGGMLGPGLHFVHGRRAQHQLRLSSQLVFGGATLGALGALVIDLSEDGNNGDGTTEDGKEGIDWPRVGTFTFIGMALGAVIDGAFFAYETRHDDSHLTFLVAPTSDGALAGFGGRF